MPPAIVNWEVNKEFPKDGENILGPDRRHMAASRTKSLPTSPHPQTRLFERRLSGTGINLQLFPDLIDCVVVVIEEKIVDLKLTCGDVDTGL